MPALKSLFPIAAKVRRLGLCLLAGSASVLFAAAPAPIKPVAKIAPIAPVGPSPITPDCRFLFVVDMSSAMQRAADGLYRTTHRLVASGLGGRMQEGDVFTVWTYADTVLTREFPLNAWTTDLNVALANRTHEFLAQQKFRGKSNLRPVFAELGQALAISTNLTIILISDGTDVIVGTPFDRAINITYGKRASETRSAKMPFITSLVTEQGEFTRWAVRAGLEDIGLPVPVKPVLPVTIVAQAPVIAPPPPAPMPVPIVEPVKPVAPVKPAAPPVVVVAKAPEPAPPKPVPVPPVVIPPAPKPMTNAAPAPAPKPPVVSPVPVKQPDPILLPATVEKKPPANLPPPVAAPKQEAKIAPPPPPKPAVVAQKPPPPVAPPVVMPTKVELVVQPLPPVVPPALRQPKSVIDASNALAKVELLRPPTSTSAPPAQPLAARVIEPKPAAPKPTNVVVAVTPRAPAAPTNSPAPKPAATPAEPKAAPAVTTTATNNPARTNTATTAVAEKPKAEASTGKATDSAKAAKPTGQLALAAPRPRDGGWGYLAAAVTLLALAGAIIARLLRPRPQPSTISQSLDEPPA